MLVGSLVTGYLGIEGAERDGKRLERRNRKLQSRVKGADHRGGDR